MITLLAHDRQTKRWGGIAATGNLCVGGWVLRATRAPGSAASQACRRAPVGRGRVEIMRDGHAGSGGCSSGSLPRRRARRAPVHGHRLNGVPRLHRLANHPACGEARLEPVRLRLATCWQATPFPPPCSRPRDRIRTFEERLPLVGCASASFVGGDARAATALAALLVVGPDMAPLSLRDDDSAPIRSLRSKPFMPRQRTPLVEWLDYVPTRADPNRQSHQGADIEAQPLPAEPIGR
ncbi:MAG: hypothetical protein H6891_12345 [Brucellaceae bacterium]|nr:hypothetical protein [Brucellaceae bacterium]